MKHEKVYLASLIFACCIALSVRSYAQLTVNVGKDTTYCSNLTTIKIPMGLKVNVQNGVEPYTYAWDCKIVPYGILAPLTASDILNDSTLMSPTFKRDVGAYVDQLKLKLQVTDHAGNTATDSMNVRFSKFTYLTGYIVVEINKGDSTRFKFSSVVGGIEPLKYQWQPGKGLTHPDSLVTWAKPEVSTQYNIIVTDSCGCVSEPTLAYDVRVIPTAVKEIQQKKENALNIRQKGKYIYFNNPLKKEAHLTFYSINGDVKYESSVFVDYFSTDRLPAFKGIYLVKITVDSITSTGKFIIP